jgi:hypothetical protein
MGAWDWDIHDLRDALCWPVRVVKREKIKIDVWVRKGGSKNLVLAHYREEDLVLVVTGTEG